MMFWKRTRSYAWHLWTQEHGIMAWVERRTVNQLRGRGGQYKVCAKWHVWVAEPGQYGVIPLALRTKKKDAAFKYATARVRMS